MKSQKNKSKYIYIIQMKGTNYFKVGRTTNLKRRLENLQTGNPVKLYIVRYWITEDDTQLEFLLHSYLAAYHINLEWFQFGIEVLEEISNIIEGAKRDDE